MSNKTENNVKVTTIIYVDEERKAESNVFAIDQNKVSIIVIANTMEEAVRMVEKAQKEVQKVAQAYTIPEPKEEETQETPVKKTPEDRVKEMESDPKIQRFMLKLEKAHDFCEKVNTPSKFMFSEANYLYYKHYGDAFNLIHDTFDLAYHRGYNKGYSVARK